MSQSIQPNYWGPHGWKFIHYVALGYPENPDLQDLVLNESDNNDEILFGKNFGCITGVNYSSDGYLYVISYLNNGAIYKIKLN